MKMISKSRSILVLCLLPIFLMCSLLWAGENPSEKKAAVVNGKAITKQELDREMRIIQVKLMLAGKPIGSAKYDEMEQKVLEDLINRELLYQECSKQDIKVKKEDVDKNLEHLRKQYSTELEFMETLEKRELTREKLRDKIKREIAIKQLIRDKFVENTAIPEDELKRFYENHLDDFYRPEQVKISQILIAVKPDATDAEKEEALKKLKAIREKAIAGENFGELAKQYSDCPSKKKGGNLGYIKKGNLDINLEKTAFSLDSGEVSEILLTKYGYHLIKCTDRLTEMTILFEKARPQIERSLIQNKVREKLYAYLENIKEKADLVRFISQKETEQND